MEPRQRLVLATFAFVIVGSAVGLLSAYAVAAPLGGIHEDKFFGPSFYRILEDFESLQAVFGPAGILLIGGMSIIAGASDSPRYFDLMTAILILGLLDILALTYFICFNDSVGSFIARNSGWDIDPTGMRERAYPFLGWTFGALMAGLAALLGVARGRSAAP